MQDINSSIYKYRKLCIFLTLNGQFAYFQSSRLKHILLCEFQPSPGMIYCGDLYTERTQTCDWFIFENFYWRYKRSSTFIWFKVGVKYFEWCGLEKNQDLNYSKALNLIEHSAKIVWHLSQLKGCEPISIFNLYISLRFKISVKNKCPVIKAQSSTAVLLKYYPTEGQAFKLLHKYI